MIAVWTTPKGRGKGSLRRSERKIQPSEWESLTKDLLQFETHNFLYSMLNVKQYESLERKLDFYLNKSYALFDSISYFV